MPCTTPPEIETTDLLAYVDGEASDRVVDHLRRCSYCHARAEAIAQQEGRLTARLYRFDCPSPHELGEYQLGMIDTVRKAMIDEHLGRCVHCSRELDQLTHYLDELQPEIEITPLQAVRSLVAQLVSGSRRALDRLQPFPLQPAMAGVRGNAQGPLVFEAEEVQISLTILPDEQTPNTFRALGLVLGADPVGARAQLWQAGQQLSSVAIDELGAFEFAGLVAGVYQLVVSGQAGEVQIPRLEI